MTLRRERGEYWNMVRHEVGQYLQGEFENVSDQFIRE